MLLGTVEKSISLIWIVIFAQISSNIRRYIYAKIEDMHVMYEVAQENRTTVQRIYLERFSRIICRIVEHLDIYLGSSARIDLLLCLEAWYWYKISQNSCRIQSDFMHSRKMDFKNLKYCWTYFACDALVQKCIFHEIRKRKWLFKSEKNCNLTHLLPQCFIFSSTFLKEICLLRSFHFYLHFWHKILWKNLFKLNWMCKRILIYNSNIKYETVYTIIFTYSLTEGKQKESI